VGSCGTTLEGNPHRKKRWRVDAFGLAHTYYKRVPRPAMVEEYFEGAQKIDVHNHMRQGPKGACLENRGTQRWDWRFFQTFLGMNVVDSFLAYRRWCPGKNKCTNKQFLRVLADGLLDNTIGCAPDAPVLRPRVAVVEETKGTKHIVHDLKPMKISAYFIGRKAAAESEGRKPPQTVLKCRLCSKNCSTFCKTCSPNTTKTRGIYALCGPGTGRDCFFNHQKKGKPSGSDSETDWEDLI